MDDPLEQRLKRALERDEPPEGFAERVMARVEQRRDREGAHRPALVPLWPFAWLFRPAWRMALVGALACMMLLSAGVAYREHQLRLKAEQERLKAEQARAELMLALEITRSKFNHAGKIVINEMNRPRMVRQ